MLEVSLRDSLEVPYQNTNFIWLQSCNCFKIKIKD
jgi:hypothetical protein